jgi:hypothetical protein
MPSLTLLFDLVHGPLAQIAVGVSEPRRQALIAENKPVPLPFVGRGLIDTGASCTCVDPAVIKHLGLEPTGTSAMLTPSTGTTPHVCLRYDACIMLFMGNEVHVTHLTLPVAETALAFQGFHALIGRDVLANGMLFYNGPAKALTLSFRRAGYSSPAHPSDLLSGFHKAVRKGVCTAVTAALHPPSQCV